ncbi:hypothetical protein [Staphylococcus pettenkoferi]|uniref:hypothetical protein n=1 Tax=Staphylococcus pettenkoferi TaxID=170573 RepID=UPI0016434784|nr:hypothetical protein [Staphylococcus pettenkoferi]
MEQNNQGIQPNPQYVIEYLTNELAAKTQENAMLKAIIQEQNENKEQPRAVEE